MTTHLRNPHISIGFSSISRTSHVSHWIGRSVLVPSLFEDSGRAQPLSKPDIQTAMLIQNGFLSHSNGTLSNFYKQREESIRDYSDFTNTAFSVNFGDSFWDEFLAKSYNYWIKPHAAAISTFECLQGVNDSGMVDHAFWSDLVYSCHLNPDVTEQSLADGVVNTIPLVAYLGWSPNKIRRNVGKACWRRLRSMSREQISLVTLVIRDLCTHLSVSKTMQDGLGMPMFAYNYISFALAHLSNFSSELLLSLIQARCSSRDFKHAFKAHIHLSGIVEQLGEDSIEHALNLISDTQRMSAQLSRPYNHQWSYIRTKKEHDELCKLLALTKASNEKIPWVAKLAKLLSGNEYESAIKLPTSSAAIYEIGIRQRHCVGSYAQSVSERRYLVVTIIHENSEATLGLNVNCVNDRYIVTKDQLYGYRNSVVESPALVSSAESIRQGIEDILNSSANI